MKALRELFKSTGFSELQKFIQELADEKSVEACHKLLDAVNEGTDSSSDEARELAEESNFYNNMRKKLDEFSRPEFAFEGCKVVSTHDTKPSEE